MALLVKKRHGTKEWYNNYVHAMPQQLDEDVAQDRMMVVAACKGLEVSADAFLNLPPSVRDAWSMQCWAAKPDGEKALAQRHTSAQAQEPL